ncbi:hypothetical protein FRC01_014624, partial [Tulasnella sp. 417]
MESDAAESRNRIMWAFCEAVKDARREHGHTHRLTLEAVERASNLYNLLYVTELIDIAKAKQAKSRSQETSGRRVRFRQRGAKRSSGGYNHATEEEGDSDSESVDETASTPAKRTMAEETSSQDQGRPAGRGVQSTSRVEASAAEDSDMEVEEASPAPQPERTTRTLVVKPAPKGSHLKRSNPSSQETSSRRGPSLVRFRLRGAKRNSGGYNQATEEKGDSDSESVDETASTPAKRTMAKASSSQDQGRPAGRGVQSTSRVKASAAEDSDMEVEEASPAPQPERTTHTRVVKPAPKGSHLKRRNPRPGGKATRPSSDPTGSIIPISLEEDDNEIQDQIKELRRAARDCYEGNLMSEHV